MLLILRIFIIGVLLFIAGWAGICEQPLAKAKGFLAQIKIKL